MNNPKYKIQHPTFSNESNPKFNIQNSALLKKSKIQNSTSFLEVNPKSNIQNSKLNISAHPHKVTKEDRSKIKNQKPCIIWFTGLSGSGKSTIANELEYKLNKMGYHTYLLDGDNIRIGLNKDLGFSEQDRKENIRRIAEVVKLFVDAGLIVITAFISPFKDDRNFARSLVEKDEFIEIFIDTPLEVCIKRDPKSLYKKALKGEIKDFTGIDSPYETPESPEVHIKTDELSVEESVEKIIIYLKEKGII